MTSQQLSVRSGKIMSEAARYLTTGRPLTHSSDLSREGLAMKATRSTVRTCEDCGKFEHLRGAPRSRYCHSCACKRREGSEAERFNASHVVDASGCWVWTRYLDRDGYGSFTYQDRRMGAHRASYLLHVGPIPDGLQIDHLCRNRACVNPAHLEAVSHRVNMLRSCAPPATNAVRTHCKYGHPFNEANTRVTISARGHAHRACRTCERDRNARYLREKADAAS